MFKLRAFCAIWLAGTVHEDVLQLYKVRKQLRLTDAQTTNSTRLVYVLKNKFDSNPRMRIFIPKSHRYQALLAVHVHEHWGVQQTTQQVIEHFYWPGWRADTAVFVNLKQVDPHDNQCINVNEVIFIDLVGPISLSNNKNKYILSILPIF